MLNDGLKADQPTAEVSTASSITAKEAAETIYVLAVKNGLLSAGVDGGPADIEDEAEEISAESRATKFEQQAVIDVFRRRPIKLITYDDKRSIVTIFTDKPVGTRAAKLLPVGIEATISVQYMSCGTPEVRGTEHSTFASQPYHIHNKRYACGSSIFPANRLGAGTFGALVIDKDGQLMGLTNNHVTGGCNHSEEGLPILAPGTADVSGDRLAPFTIGRHLRLCPIHDGHPAMISISDNLDAAIFAISNGDTVTSMQGTFYDTPSQVAPIEPGMRVEKVGRSTGRTIGNVVGVSVAPSAVHYDMREINVRKHVFFPAEHMYIVKADGDGVFSAGGDSGSLVTTTLENGERRAVGLVFAGNERTKTSIIAPLNVILAQLNVTLVSDHGVT